MFYRFLLYSPGFFFAFFQAEGSATDNVALGRPYLLDPPPNYPLCTESGDTTQLTDGERVYNGGSDAQIWTREGTVGWSYKLPPIVAIDLGEERKISGVSYSTAAGAGEVHWPKAILLFTSPDGKAWKYSGDLVRLSNRTSAPPENQAMIWRYRTNDLRATGRYVALGIEPLPYKANYVFSDEIEVFAGNHEKDIYEGTVEGEGLPGIREFMAQRKFRVAIEDRLHADAQAVLAKLEHSGLPDPERKTLSERIKAAQEKIKDMKTPNPADFKAVFPMHPIHEEIFSVYGQYLQAEGVPRISVTKKHRYASDDLFPAPEELKKEGAQITVELARNERRSDAILLTNANTEQRSVSLRFLFTANAASANLDQAVKLTAVPWTDTLQHEPVASALPVMTPVDGEYHLTLPAGLSTKIWVSVNAENLPEGRYEGRLELLSGEEVRSVPCTIRVSAVEVARPRLLLGMWDYTHPKPFSGLTPENVEASIATMKAYGIDIAWAMKNVLPWPRSNAFTPENQLTEALDFTEMKKWLEDRKESKRFMIYGDVRESFAGEAMDSPNFAPRVGAWAHAIVEEFKRLGISPDRVGIALVDEPHTEKQDARVVAWAKAIRSGTSELRIFQNPTWPRPDQTTNQPAITMADIVTPYATVYEAGGPAVADYFEARRQAGQELWFYLCAGPTRLFDPTSYYRNFGWFAFSRQATAIVYWSFGDIGGNPSSWNEYTAQHDSFSPLFITPNSIDSSIHMEALHEGMQDHELLSLLQERLSGSEQNDAWAAEVRIFLTQGPETVLSGRRFTARWKEAAEVDTADVWRLKALDLLERKK